MILRLGPTLVVALLGGWIFVHINVPLPWLLGPVASVVVWSSLLGGKPYWPVGIRNAALLVLGYLMGRPFTLEAAHQVASQFPAMALMTLLTVLFSLAMSYMTYRQTGISLASCVIGGVPGGLAQMVLLGEEIPSADGTIVAFMQTIRVLAVVFSIPFLAIHGLAGGAPAGAAQAPVFSALTPAAVLPFILVVLVSAWLAIKVKLPTPHLLGPVLGTCLLVLNGLPAPLVPAPIIIAAQVAMGAYIGKNINLSSMESQWRTILPYTLLNVALVVLFSISLGWVLTLMIPATLVTGFLSTAPGGVAEMGLTAMLVNADLSTVVAYQIFRVFFILLVMPFMLKRWLCREVEGA
ncbi:MAG: AbrB family transcriptional regulator [Negativicutes bacterium]|nr:AbrB family transcriptional regulator [Negativicutes bacterium]